MSITSAADWAGLRQAADVARITLDALESGAEEVLADEPTRAVKRSLSASEPIYLTEPQV